MSLSTAAPERVFRQNPVRAVLGAIVLAVVLDALAFVIIPQVLPDTIYTSRRWMIVLSAVAVITIAVLVIALWLRNLQVKVSRDAVVIGRAGKWDTYSRATTGFRTHITEHRTNGVRSGTTRALVVRTALGEKTVPLPGFSRAVFNELAAAINPIEAPVSADPVESARLRAGLPTTFEVDASGERRFANKLLVVAAVALVIALVALVPAFTPGFLRSDAGVLVAVVPLGAVVAIGFGIGGFQSLARARRTAARITIGAAGIRIGDVDHPYAQLSRIWLTPPAYGTKRMTLQSTSGRSIHLLDSERVDISPAYAQFVASLHARVADRPGLLSLDLE